METTEVLKQIDEIRDRMYQANKFDNGDTLSNAVVRLAVCNSYLGEKVTETENEANQMEASYKLSREAMKLEKIKDGMSATQAESQAYVDNEELLNDLNRRQYAHKALSIKRTDTNNLIDAMRSRISYLRQEREKS